MYSNAKHRAKQKITTSSVCPPAVTDIAEEVANLCFNFRGRLWCQSKYCSLCHLSSVRCVGNQFDLKLFELFFFNLYCVQVNVCTRGAFYSSHVHTTHLQVNSDHGFVQEPPVKTVMDAWRRRSWMLYCQALPAKSCTWEGRCKARKRLFCLYYKTRSIVLGTYLLKIEVIWKTVFLRYEQKIQSWAGLCL